MMSAPVVTNPFGSSLGGVGADGGPTTTGASDPG